MKTQNVLCLYSCLCLVGVAAFAQNAPETRNAVPIGSVKPAAQTAPAPESTLLAVGEVAPDFVTKDLDGKEVKLSDFKGKVVVLDFWATWCGPCIASLPHTQELAKRYKSENVVVLAACTSDTRNAFETWVKTNKSSYPDIVFTCDPNERGENRASKKLYGVSGIPTQFVIGTDGKITAALVGYRQGDTRLDTALSKAVAAR